MKNVYFDNARNLKFHFRINRAFQKDFVFYEKPDEGEDPSVPYDINGYTFEMTIKKFPGDRKNVLRYTTSGGGLSFPAYNEHVLRATGTAVQTRIEEGEYYIEINRTDVNKTWLNGWAYFSFGPTDSSDDTSTDIIIDESGTALTVVIHEEEITDDDIISALGYTPSQSSDFVGLQDLYIPATAMWPRATSGCASIARTEISTSLVNIQSLDFDQTTQEFAQFTISLPRNWNRGTITAKIYWTAASGSGTVQWGISGGAYSNDDALTVALGSAQTVDDTLIAANDLHVTDATGVITLAGSPADADFLAIQISRNPASDTLSADAKLLGIVITLTTDAGVAA